MFWTEQLPTTPASSLLHDALRNIDKETSSDLIAKRFEIRRELQMTCTPLRNEAEEDISDFYGLYFDGRKSMIHEKFC